MVEDGPRLGSLVLLFFLLIFISTTVLNVLTKRSYKREKNNNCKKFSAKRCLEDGKRDYIYLIEEKSKTYQRIVNLYILDKLGYPRPSRDDKECFSLFDGYVLKNEIKIYNLISDIREIVKLQTDKI